MAVTTMPHNDCLCVMQVDGSGFTAMSASLMPDVCTMHCSFAEMVMRELECNAATIRKPQGQVVPSMVRFRVLRIAPHGITAAALQA